MRLRVALIAALLSSVAVAQTTVTEPGVTIPVPVAAGTNFPVTIPSITVTYTIPAQTFATAGSTVPYVVPSIPLLLTVNGTAGGGGTGSGGTGTPPPNNCGLTLGGAVIFCDTFDAPKNGGTRSGDLDPDVWGVSRAIGFVNLGQGQYESVNRATTSIVTCNGTKTVAPPGDVIICNGQLREATNDNPENSFDNGIVTALAMYPKQPFDFAGRTGTVGFDVSNDSQGNHAAWPEFWFSDLPVPAPFKHGGSWLSLPANGFGIRMGAVASPGQYGLCPNANNTQRWTADSVVIVRNYQFEDLQYNGIGDGVASGAQFKILDCVTAPKANSGVMNHIEIRISTASIDVYATDAGVAPSSSTLRHIATISNAQLSATRGLVWLEDAHYNADKETVLLGTAPSISQRQHTFVWDNLAFDGPFTYRDFSFDALDALQSNQTWYPNEMNLGKVSGPGKTASWSVLGIPANPSAAAVRVLFNFSLEAASGKPNLQVIVNGHSHVVAWPYPDAGVSTWRAYALTIPVTDLVAGTNVVQLGADSNTIVTSNVNIVLVNVAGGVPVLPVSNNAYPLQH